MQKRERIHRKFRIVSTKVTVILQKTADSISRVSGILFILAVPVSSHCPITTPRYP
ncbi:hypothetical protein DFP93_10887 [Aneurinibacillus soli]|uniref:Uncharacterized protein n=1 Tax=Aneurinibacillus soli TaxID=1500254 RepID=A0A0U4NBX2_9BACL|nr:hypothetical protein DFP93_10887 [Aneurinibacillus soli]BAU26532.1 hypothetical protein CB4_00659 [Aneurinibacillus soli]